MLLLYFYLLEPSYIWIRNDETIAKGNALLVNKPMQHADAGVYTCIARNKHGNGSANANINILCEYGFKYPLAIFKLYISLFLCSSTLILYDNYI